MSAILSQVIRRQIAISLNRSQAGVTAATAGEHSGGYKVWKRLSFFVAIPAVGLCMLNAYLKHQEEHDHPRAEFIKYEYLRRREKRFPWGEGNKSLFHNPHVNPLPDGYEH
ncbi:cytochrome c oxidase subunit 6A, mitochondrial [Bactrocera neohumeralis]|uniref:Cytochrome c oxidase subunit 6A, mitochondrial n=1 Tax=Bactrocera dorsalis TaxID=27457 RepID=A0A034WU53_BACDO|nr:cytochrome c oxidase subunit 6A, mitochondrial [Bactrocera dorsalis]XP_039953800.1 cytochrome c oxidase subunit 6A, mitochondrial [Bactrocera tryoni]XP_050326133.1 cytochrome c oxidase subunit 6A, mitochondrial [Bactrocera neohumeralis]